MYICNETLYIYWFCNQKPLFVCSRVANERKKLHYNFVFVSRVQLTTLQSVFRSVPYPDRVVESKPHQTWHAPIFCPGGCPSQSIVLVTADMLGSFVRCGKIDVFLLYSRSSGLYHLRFAFDRKPRNLVLVNFVHLTSFNSI